MKSKWFKENPEDKIWWKNTFNSVGEFVFSFDKQTEFNLFRDYPWKLSANQREIFDKENPYWADFFKDRSE